MGLLGNQTVGLFVGRKSGKFLGGDCRYNVGVSKQCLKLTESGYNNLRISIESQRLIGSAKKLITVSKVTCKQ